MRVIKLSILCALAMGMFHSYAQDVITLKSGEEIKAKVEEISSTQVKYKRFDNLEGPTVILAKEEVFFIKYENGTKEIINSAEEKSDSPQSITNGEYVILHVYRKGVMGGLVNYDLFLEDRVICYVRSNWKETVKIDKAGLITLWARTEAKVELPITVEAGKEYYIRCGVSMGIIVGRPKLELVDEVKGKKEFESIK